jgi:catechol 2,3-dioxygenase
MNTGTFKFSHLGIYVQDIDRMVEFYTSTLGFLVTDRGEGRGSVVVFLSRNPSDHHQLALVTGRRSNFHERMVQQISFRVDSLEVLKAMYPRVIAAPVSDVEPVFHGISFSLYFRDPEGNRLEFFTDSEWYVKQPCVEPLDLTMPAAQIYAEKKVFCEEQPDFRLLKDWRSDFEQQFANLKMQLDVV